MLKDSRLHDNCFDIIRCICTSTVREDARLVGFGTNH